MNQKKYLKKINLIKLLEYLGLKNIEPNGDNIQACCPFHNDHTPSWGINKHNGVWNCFTCKSKGKKGSGNLISLIGRIKGLNIRLSYDFLRNWAGFKIESVKTPKEIKTRLKGLLCKDNEYNRDNDDKYIMKTQMPKFLIRDYYYGIKYFKDRGINQATINKANITFCTKGYYKNRAIIPSIDENDNMVGFEARDITRLQEKKVLYPKDCKINKNLYNINNAKIQKDVVIVEGCIDALYLIQRGFNVVSTFGTGISDKQAEMLNKYFDKIYLAYDFDKAGKEAIIEYGKKLILHLSVYIITLPNNKDPKDVSGQEFRHLYNNAEEFNHFCSKIFIKKNKKQVDKVTHLNYAMIDARIEEDI